MARKPNPSSIRLSPAQRAYLRQCAKAQGHSSMSDVVRGWIDKRMRSDIIPGKSGAQKGGTRIRRKAA